MTRRSGTPLHILDRGFVTLLNSTSPLPVAVGGRCAHLGSGELVSTYMLQAAIGRNDFRVTLSRSSDGGRSWTVQGPVWPQHHERHAIYGSISQAPKGELFIYGIRTPIDVPGESFWSDATQGMKPNELFWARSVDGGLTWSEPAVIPRPTPGSAEAPGALLVTREGRWIATYAPYNTFDPDPVVELGQIVAVWSDDEGRTWSAQAMMRFGEEDSSAAQAWVVELADGRLLGTGWHIDGRQAVDYPTPWTLSSDGGRTWAPHGSTGLLGQSTGLAALPGGRAALVYNQRKHDEKGVWLAILSLHGDRLRVQSNDIVWSAQRATGRDTSGNHADWTDFAFGEPSVTVVDDTLIVLLWCQQPSGSGIAYVRVKLNR